MPGKPTIKRTCGACGAVFMTWPYVIRNGHGLFCSRTCSYKTMGKRLSDYALRSRKQVQQPSHSKWKLVPVGRRHMMKVSNEDFKWASTIVWTSEGGYAHSGTMHGDQPAHHMIISRVLGRNVSINEEVDHKSRDKFDNRRSNLRISTRSENASNIGITSRNTSGYKGVSWDKTTRMWKAHVRVQGIGITIGRFDDLMFAASMYDQYATQLHGDFAVLNFEYI